MTAFQVPSEFQNACPAQVFGVPAILFTQLIQNLLRLQCEFASRGDYPRDYGNDFREAEDRFDFVVVGAGSAGSVVANRLSENPQWKVLLLEAGGDPTFVSDVPALLFSTQGSEMDWQFLSEPSEFSCRSMKDGRCAYPRGRVLGGTSTINAMLYVRGNREDYDEWERLGNPGWGYEAILPYFMKSENISNIDLVSEHQYNSLLERPPKTQRVFGTVSEKFHSNGGYLPVEQFGVDEDAAKIRSLVLEAFEEIGIRYQPDINGEHQIGITKLSGTVKGGVRANTARMFLAPVKARPNLYVIKNAVVERLVLDGKRVTGVEFTRNGKTAVASATKEVILCGGAIGSPQLLMVSGIGPKRHLQSLGIAVVEDRKGVGQNFQDHVTLLAIPYAFSVLSPPSENKAFDEFYRFLSSKSGSFTSIGLTDLTSFVDTKSNTGVPDIQYHFIFYRNKNFFSVSEVNRVARWREYIAEQFVKLVAEKNLLIISPTLLRPKSRGRIELVSRSVHDPPRIIANMLQEEDDVDTMVRGIKMLSGLKDSCAFNTLGAEVVKINITECSDLNYDSVDYWKCYLQHMASSIYHPVGTCKMGPADDPMAVVDHRLKVHGIEGLRVADASIMPLIVRGNTNAPCIMIGEKAADLIKSDWATS